jgi:hypothetical protein
MPSDGSEQPRGRLDLHGLLAGDLPGISVIVRSRASRWSPLDTAAACEARAMRYGFERDGADLVLALDPRDEPHLARRWDGRRPRYLDGLVVRVVDLRVSPLLRQRPGAPDRASFVPTTERLDPGTVFRFEIDGVEVARAVYGVDRMGGVLVEDLPAHGTGIGMPMRNAGESPVMSGRGSGADPTHS